MKRKNLIIIGGLAAALLPSPLARAEDDVDLDSVYSVEEVERERRINGTFDISFAVRDQIYPWRDTNVARINVPLLEQFPEEYTPISLTEHSLLFGVEGRLMFDLNEYWSLGPFTEFSFFAGGGRRDEQDFPLNVGGASIGNIDISYDSKLGFLGSIVGGMALTYRPLDWFHLNLNLGLGISFISSETVFHQRLTADDSILEAARAMGNSPETRAITLSRGRGFLFVLGGGPEFLFGDNHRYGIFFDAGLSLVEMGLHNDRKIYDEGELNTVEQEYINVDFSGFYFQAGFRFYFKH